MTNQPIRFSEERSYPMPVAEAWRLLADTDHLNRTIGLPSVEFSALPDPLVPRARARAFGVIPVRCSAVRGDFEGGPIASMVVGMGLFPAEPGVTVRSYAECTPASPLGRL